MSSLRENFHKVIRWIQHFSNRPWYPFLVGVLAGLDNWILVVPTDGLVISGVLLTPKKWLQFAGWTGILSTAGAVSFAAFISWQGLAYVETHWPLLMTTEVWTWTSDFFDRRGLLVIFLIAATPMAQQPAMILAGLAETPLSQLLIVVLAGRCMKYFILCGIAAKAPELLSKLWGVNELGPEDSPLAK